MPDANAGFPPRYLRTLEAARFLSLSGRTLEKHRTYGTGPAYRKIGGRVVYLPIGVPMLKRVLALPGQTVCRKGVTISVDGIEMGEALSRDSRGRPLPVWQGCRVVGADEIFLMNWQSEDSLDGRYFGLVPHSSVIGKALPVWTREE